MSRLKLAVVVSHPIQYHAVVWRALAASDSLDVDVLFCSDRGVRGYRDPEFGVTVQWDRPLTEGYQHEFLPRPGLAGREVERLGHFNPAVVSRLTRSGYDALLLHGVNHPTHVMALATAKAVGLPVLVRAIGYNLGERSVTRCVARRLYHGTQYRLADAVLYAGRHNYEYFRSFGVPDESLFFAPHVVDNRFFCEACREHGQSQNSAREFLGIGPRERVILFCGKLIPKKQPDLLLRSFLQADLPLDWTLLYVGEGELRQDLEAKARHASPRRVRFTGFLNQSELPKAYAQAEILVLSSMRETWGLVVNEAMNCGCAVIVSDRVGCYPELVEDVSGLVFPHNDHRALSRNLEKLVSDDELRRRCQARAREKIDIWGPEEFVTGVERALSEVGG